VNREKLSGKTRGSCRGESKWSDIVGRGFTKRLEQSNSTAANQGSMGQGGSPKRAGRSKKKNGSPAGAVDGGQAGEEKAVGSFTLKGKGEMSLKNNI